MECKVGGVIKEDNIMDGEELEKKSYNRPDSTLYSIVAREAFLKQKQKKLRS